MAKTHAIVFMLPDTQESLMKQQTPVHGHQPSYPVLGGVLEFNKVMVVVLNTLQLGSKELEGIEEW